MGFFDLTVQVNVRCTQDTQLLHCGHRTNICKIMIDKIFLSSFYYCETRLSNPIARLFMEKTYRNILYKITSQKDKDETRDTRR